jgi:hypothetical protein
MIKEQTKQCTKCKEVKTLDMYYKRKEGILGVKSSCKECALKAKKKWYNKNIEEIAEKSKNTRKNNSEYYKDKDREYRERHRDSRIKNSEKNNEKIRKSKIDKLKEVTEINKDTHTLLYIMSYKKGLYKVGTSNSISRRRAALRCTTKEKDLEVLYTGIPWKGRAYDAEQIAHYDLKEFRKLVVYPNARTEDESSREWYECDLDYLLRYINENLATMNKYNK